MSKSTSLAQLQNSGDMNESMDNGGNMNDVDEVMNQLGNQEQYFEQQQQLPPQNPHQAQMLAAQQQQAQMLAAQQHQAQMMAAQEQQAQMMAAHQLQQQQQAQMMASQSQMPSKNMNNLLHSNAKQQTFVEKLLSELKDSLVVLIVFVLLNFKPVQKLTLDLLSKFVLNENITLLARGLLAGVLYYVIKRLILNQ